MAGVSFTDEQLERALENFNTAAEIKKFLADEDGNEPSPLSLKNRIFNLMQKNQTFYRVEGLDRAEKYVTNMWNIISVEFSSLPSCWMVVVLSKAVGKIIKKGKSSKLHSLNTI